MADPDTPVTDPEQGTAPDPIKYVQWVHLGDPGWYETPPGANHGTVSVAWKLHFDGVKVERHRGEPDPHEHNDDPWWMRAQAHRDLVSSWQVRGGATLGTELALWVGGEDVEVVEADATRLRVKVCGRDVLTPLGAPVPVAPKNPRMPVQVVMFVNRLTIGPMLDSPMLWPGEQAPVVVDDGYERAQRQATAILARIDEEGGDLRDAMLSWAAGQPL